MAATQRWEDLAVESTLGAAEQQTCREGSWEAALKVYRAQAWYTGESVRKRPFTARSLGSVNSKPGLARGREMRCSSR